MKTSQTKYNYNNKNDIILPELQQINNGLFEQKALVQENYDNSVW